MIQPRDMVIGTRGWMREVGRRLAAARKCAGISREQAAHRGGLAVASVKAAELGTKAGRLSTVLALCRAVGAPLSILDFGQTGTVTTPTFFAGS